MSSGTKAGDDSVIEVSPDVMSGASVFRGTRVPVKYLLEYLAVGDSLDRFLEQFPTVSRAQAVAVIELAERLVVGGVDESSTR